MTAGSVYFLIHLVFGCMFRMFCGGLGFVRITVAVCVKENEKRKDTVPFWVCCQPETWQCLAVRGIQSSKLSHIDI